ncbi:MAG TPA: hypothetical protein V6C76_11490 [Drouetiella sp.]
MARFKLTAVSRRCEINYYIDADSEEEAKKKWEDMDSSLGEIDEDSVDTEEFDRIKQL